MEYKELATSYHINKLIQWYASHYTYPPLQLELFSSLNLDIYNYNALILNNNTKHNSLETY